MPIPTRGAIPVVASESRTRTELILEGIALRHQIAVLKGNGTRRPRSTLGDRLFWILLSWWWPRWRESLMIVQPETVRRWRRNGWSGLWRHRSRGRWRGGRPRVSREVRGLITRMARENFLWGAPRIHGELLMLGYKVSQSIVSRYLAISYRHPDQSWRTFIRNQAIAFSYWNDPEDADADHSPLRPGSSRDQIIRFASPIVRLEATARQRQAYETLARPARRITVRHGCRAQSAQLNSLRFATAPGRSLARANLPTAVHGRGPPGHMELPQNRGVSC
jgi:hypothetical protein